MIDLLRLIDFFRLMLDASIRIALVAFGVGAILMVTRVRSGAVRHGAWTAVLCAMLLMPVLPNLTPGIRVVPQAPAMSWSIDSNGDPEAATGKAMRSRQAGEPGSKPAQVMAQVMEASRPGQPVSHDPAWLAAVLALYLAGVAILLTRMAAGWRSTRRLARSAEPLAVPMAGVYQSADIATPLIVGVIDPRILLPRSWTEWPDAKLQAVLAHEMAHLRRRDTLIALAAGLNQCVFWFHPLAWWLQRQLAATAEQACDEAGVHAMGQGREYAEVLLEMAEAVHRRGGRISWAGLGMYSAGSLQRRIDRVLSGDAALAIPRRHKVVVAMGCAASIFLGAACHQAGNRAGKPDSAGTESTARKLDSQESFRRGNFYSAVLMARPEAYEMGRLNPADYRAFGAEIRKRLERSDDPTLLLQTSTTLVAWGRDRQKEVPADFDLLAFGKSLVDRALQLDPKSVWAHQLLNVAADQELLRRLPEAVWQGSLESRHQAIQSLPEGDRFRELAILAMAAGDEGVRADQIRHDAAEAKAAWGRAGRYAREALDMASKGQSHPDYGTAFFQANMALGMAAIQEGDSNAARAYLLKAAEAPVTEMLQYPVANARPWRMNWHFPSILAEALLEAGQSDAVIQFLEKYASITVAGRERCLENIALIRAGKKPSWPTGS